LIPTSAADITLTTTNKASAAINAPPKKLMMLVSAGDHLLGSFLCACGVGPELLDFHENEFCNFLFSGFLYIFTSLTKHFLKIKVHCRHAHRFAQCTVHRWTGAWLLLQHTS
jgi:hypothetical protein